MCDMLLKDMHIGIFNLLVLQQILLRSLDVSSLKNILLNSVFFEKLRRFDSSPFEANQTLVKCHIFKYCVSATKTHSKKERNCLICLKPLLLLLFCPFFLPFRYLHNLLLANSFSTKFPMPIRGKVSLLCILNSSALIYSILTCLIIKHKKKKSNLITRRFKWVVLQLKKIWQEIEDPCF